VIDYDRTGRTESGYYVTRRECGSCRFFEQSDIGESGWCRNQRCQEIVGIALVRRQELACRIGWDRDYYEAAAGANDLLPGQNRPAPDPARQRSGYQGMRPDDIIVGVEQPRTITEEPQMPVARSRTSNVGEAHRRALERRQIAQQSGDTVPPRRLETVAAPDATAGSIGERRDDRRSPRAAVVGDEGVGRPRLADTPPSSPPIVQQAPHTAITTNIPVMSDPGYDEQRIASSYRTPPPGARTPPSREYEQPLPPRQAESTLPPRSNDAPGAPPTPRGGQPQPLEAEWYAAERQRNRGKRCANCRDFQTAESGDRGWCRNRFAFPTPQLVGPNDLACLSCIGTWWAANDQWWLAKAAVSPHIAGTPLADALLEEMHDDEKRHGTKRRPGAG
jgi:hypothetical protein